MPTENGLKINFVTENPPYWILGQWCHQYQKHIPGSTITHMAPDFDADVNVYVNYALFKFKTPSSKSICVFTHREKDGRQYQFDNIAKQCDWCFGQSDYTMSFLPPEKSSKLTVGLPDMYEKEIVIGMAGRRYSSGRKRIEWGEEVNKIPGVKVVFTDGKIPYHEMTDFYDSCDYILITSEMEGGPMSIKEALARGKMVISTKVGWYNEFPILTYDTLPELLDLVKKLVISYDEFEIGARQIVEKAAELCDNLSN